MHDRCTLFAQPPESAAEAVERLGRVGQVERFLERVASVVPVPRCERLVPSGESIVRDSRRHEKHGGTPARECEGLR